MSIEGILSVAQFDVNPYQEKGAPESVTPSRLHSLTCLSLGIVGRVFTVAEDER
jgi:hypothetical protein